MIVLGNKKPILINESEDYQKEREDLQTYFSDDITRRRLKYWDSEKPGKSIIKDIVKFTNPFFTPIIIDDFFKCRYDLKNLKKIGNNKQQEQAQKYLDEADKLEEKLKDLKDGDQITKNEAKQVESLIKSFNQKAEKLLKEDEKLDQLAIKYATKSEGNKSNSSFKADKQQEKEEKKLSKKEEKLNLEAANLILSMINNY